MTKSSCNIACVVCRDKHWWRVWWLFVWVSHYTFFKTECFQALISQFTFTLKMSLFTHSFTGKKAWIVNTHGCFFIHFVGQPFRLLIQPKRKKILMLHSNLGLPVLISLSASLASFLTCSLILLHVCSLFLQTNTRTHLTLWLSTSEAVKANFLWTKKMSLS